MQIQDVSGNGKPATGSPLVVTLRFKLNLSGHRKKYHEIEALVEINQCDHTLGASDYRTN